MIILSLLNQLVIYKFKFRIRTKIAENGWNLLSFSPNFQLFGFLLNLWVYKLKQKTMRFLRILFYSTIILVAGVFYFSKKSDKHSIKGDGNILAENRDVAEFHSIKVYGGYEVFLRQSDDYHILVEADENLHSNIITEVSHGVLTIRNEGRLKSSDDMKLYITAPNFRAIEAHGAVEIESEESIHGESMEIKVSGAAEIDLELEVENLSAHFSGAGDVELEGKAKRADVSISGAGKLEAYNLRTEEVKVSISGAGYAEVFASESLNVGVSGAGSVRYRGNPSSVSKSISGAGSVSAD